MKKNKLKHIVIDNIKTLLVALIIAILIRSLIIQPFIYPRPQWSRPLLIGDRIFVTKYTYGYSKHSFPFSPNFSNQRFFSNEPKQGDLVVFKTPVDNRTDYIKRLIGLPGDEIQFIDGNIFINEKKIIRKKKIEIMEPIRCGNNILRTKVYVETLPNGVQHFVAYNADGTLKIPKYKVPKGHYFLMGDNRDCSKDSRFLNDVGYVKNLNLVGEAKFIFFQTTQTRAGY